MRHLILGEVHKEVLDQTGSDLVSHVLKSQICIINPNFNFGYDLRYVGARKRKTGEEFNYDEVRFVLNNHLPLFIRQARRLSQFVNKSLEANNIINTSLKLKIFPEQDGLREHVFELLHETHATYFSGTSAIAMNKFKLIDRQFINSNYPSFVITSAINEEFIQHQPQFDLQVH